MHDIYKIVGRNGNMHQFSPYKSEWTDTHYDSICKRILRKTGKFEIINVEDISDPEKMIMSRDNIIAYKITVGEEVELSRKQRVAKLREHLEFERICHDI